LLIAAGKEVVAVAVGLTDHCVDRFELSIASGFVLLTGDLVCAIVIPIDSVPAGRQTLPVTTVTGS